MTNQELVERTGREWSKTGNNKGGDMNAYLSILIKLAREDEREICIAVIEKMMGDWQLGRDVIATLRGEK